jgi:hypothetical protein
MDFARTVILAIASFILAGPATAAAAISTPAVGETQATAPKPVQAQVMIVGVAHFLSRRDVHNSKFTDSPLSSKRQVQIADIVRRLGHFHPTKVLIEVTMGNPVITESYSRYLRGTYALPADEPYQLGFKLAKRSGNRTIYPIDTFGPELLNDDSRSDAFLKSHFNTVDDAPFEAYLARDSALEKNGTYLDVLRNLNTDDSIRANASWYSVFDGLGRAADNAGASYVSQWYARNRYIFSNILSVLSPADRAVVIIGQGHEYLLREFIRLNPNLRDVNPLPYFRS